MGGRDEDAQQRLTLLALALFAVAGALVAHLQRAAPPDPPLPLPIAAVAVLLVLAELGRLHVEVRRSAITITLSESALIVALFTLRPADAVLLRLAACAPVLLYLYRRSLSRMIVNAGNMLFESAVCAAVLGQFGPGSPLSLRSWLVAMLAVQVSGLLAGLVVNLAIRLNGDTETLREVFAGLALGASISAATGVLGVVGVALAAGAREGRLLLLAAITVGLLVYRGYARLQERKAALESVHGFSRSLDTDDGTLALLHTILAAVPDLVGAARAEIVLSGDNGSLPTLVRLRDGAVRLQPARDLDWPVRQVLDSAQAVVLGRHSRQRSVREILRSGSMRELMIAPLPAENGARGALIAIDRLGQVRGFRRADLMLFETLALHAGVALTNVGLVDRLRHDIEHDRLTGLLNRHGMANVVAAIDHPCSVVLVQLSSLQDVNDALGHAAADALLVAAAARIRAAVHEDDLVGRIDDDVFAALLTHPDVLEATELAERLTALVAEPIDLGDVPVSLTAAVGIAVGDTTGDVIRHAEIALRAAKGRGAGLRIYEPGMEPPSARRLSIAAELREVLANPALSRQVVAFYQPKADVETGSVRAVEALVRWRHPQQGLIPPGEFIPVVESTDLVRPLTLHVLDRALADAVRWANADRALSVAVNLSARSLHDPRLVDDVTSLLQRHDANPGLLTLEITESAVMDDPDRAIAVLEELAALGVSLSVDDFGTGYSSLAYLARLPVDEVKIDQMFVSRMTRDPRDAAVVRSVVDLGHSLNLCVVAEGVEDAECWDALAEAGVDVIQGYLLSHPLPVEDLERWLRDREVPVGTAPHRRAHPNT